MYLLSQHPFFGELPTSALRTSRFNNNDSNNSNIHRQQLFANSMQRQDRREAAGADNVTLQTGCVADALGEVGAGGFENGRLLSMQSSGASHCRSSQ